MGMIGLLIGLAPVWAAHWYDYSGRLGVLPAFVACRLLFAGSALICAFFMALVAEGWKRSGIGISRWAVGLGLGLVAGMVMYSGHRLFDSVDGGFVTDLAWRLHQGQKPYLDFPCTTPPFFNEFCRCAWNILPATWSGLILAWAFWGLVLQGTVFLLLKSSGTWSASLGSMSVAGGCVLLHSYPFYNPMGWGFFCVALAAWWGARFCSTPDLRWMALGVICGLGFLQKPNLLPAWFLLILSVGPAAGWKRCVEVTVVAVGTLGIFCWLWKIPLVAYLDSLRGISATRGNILNSPALTNPPLLDLLLLLGVAATLGWGWRLDAFRSNAERLGVSLWAASAGMAGILGFFLNAEMRLSDLMPAAFAGTLLLLRKTSTRQANWNWLAGATISLFFFLCGALLGWQRVRVPTSASFSLNPREKLTLVPDGILAGTWVQEDILEMRNDLRKWPDLIGKPGIFLGPTLEWAYPEFSADPPTGLPLNWTIGTMVWDLKSAEKNWRKNNFQWIILHKKRPLPPVISGVITRNYSLESRGAILDRYQKKP